MTTRGKKVLIVEDQKVLRAMLQFLFTSKGFLVEHAESGKEALEFLETTIPDVIILDLIMPVMDGFEFCAKLKSMYPGKNIPIIVLSSLSAEKNKKEIMSLGVSDYMEKPFKSQQIVDKVQKLMVRTEFHKKTLAHKPEFYENSHYM